MTARGSAHREAQGAAAVAVREEESLRDRWEARQAEIWEHWEEPIARATAVTRRTLAWFPVRVWRHFLQNNGFLLAAGVSYQGLFAIFASIYVAFAVAGLWLGGSPDAIRAMIDVINSYIPGLIGEGGLFTTTQVTQIATSGAGVLGVTGLIATGTVAWTAIGFVTFTRRAVRDIFALPPDRRGYVVLKAKDLLAALIFGIALVAGSVLGAAGTWALEIIFRLLGWDTGSAWYEYGVRLGSIAVSFAVYTAALAALFRFLTGTSLRWRPIWPGALLGGGAITVLQLGAGWLLGYTPNNPLLATFAIFVGLLLWFRVIGVIILVAAAWIAVAARDDDLPLVAQTEAERVAVEHAALLTAARVRVRTARVAQSRAPWFKRFSTDRAVRAAEHELAEVTASAPVSRNDLS